MVKGTSTSFAILENRQVMGWGSSKNGKLGFPLANGKNYDLPKEIIALSDYEVYQIAAGPFHTLILTIDGLLLSMGNSKDGKLGYEIQGSSVIDIEQPIKLKDVPLFFCYQTAKTVMKQYPLFNLYNDYGRIKPVYNKGKAYEINQVRCGENFQLFLTNNGELYSCGSNKNGQLGIENDDEDEDEDEEEEGSHEEGETPGDETAFLPKHLQKKIVDLEKKQDRWLPERVPFNNQKVKYVAAGASHVIALMESDVYAWGRNNFGQLGIGGQKVEQVYSPQKIKSFNADLKVVQAACGENHSVFLLVNGSVMTCGSNEFGQLGLFQDAAIGEGALATGGTQEFTTPTLIEKSYLENVTFIAAGRFHTLVIRRQTEGSKDDEKEDKGQAQEGEEEMKIGESVNMGASASVTQIQEEDEQG